MYKPIVYPDQDDSIFGTKPKKFTALVSAQCHEGALSGHLLWESLHFAPLLWKTCSFFILLLMWFLFFPFMLIAAVAILMLLEIGELGVTVLSHLFSSFFFRMY